MSALPATTVAARLAANEVRRRPWRTLLVAGLVAGPVAALILAPVWIRTNTRTVDDFWREHNGAADLTWFVEQPPEGGAAVDTFSPLLPPSSAVTTRLADYSRVLRTADGHRASVRVVKQHSESPILTSWFVVMAGRVPAAPGEVFLSRSAAADLGVGVGDELHLVRPEPLTWQVVGTGEVADNWGGDTVVVEPTTPFPITGESLASEHLARIGRPLSPGLIEAIRSSEGALVASPAVEREVRGNDPLSGQEANQAARVAWGMVFGVLALMIVGIVIAAAFAAGARRQLVTLGQLGANGASPRLLRRTLMLQGALAGVIGSVLGGGVAAVVLVVLAPHRSEILKFASSGYRYSWLEVALALAFGVITATVAATIPARATSRIPVLAALAGRRPPRQVPRWVTAGGLGGFLAGTGLLALAVIGSTASQSANRASIWAATAVGGGVLMLLGMCATAPAYVDTVGPLARRAGGEIRLAARGIVRQRTRSAAVVAAVCAVSALAIAASSSALALADRPERWWMRPDEVVLHSTRGTYAGAMGDVALPAADLRRILQVVPGATVTTLQALTAGDATAPGGPVIRSIHAAPGDHAQPTGDGEYVLMSFGSGVALADDAFLGLYDLPPAATDALRTSGAVVLGQFNGSGQLRWEDMEQQPTAASAGQRSADQPVRFVRTTSNLDFMRGLLLSPAAAERLGFVAVPSLTVLRYPHRLTGAQRAALQELNEDYWAAVVDAYGRGDRSPRLNVTAAYAEPYQTAVNKGAVEGALSGLALLVALGVIGAALALSAAETREERDVLAVVGASPRTLRRTSGLKATLLAVLGAVMAVPVGLIPIAIYMANATTELTMHIPWRTLAVLLVGVPVIVGLVTTTGSGVASRLRPITASRMTVD